MGKQKESKYIECPFFHYYDGCKISCEGVQKDSALHLSFSTTNERREYMKSTCFFNHKNCMVAQALYNKYNNLLSNNR